MCFWLTWRKENMDQPGTFYTDWPYLNKLITVDLSYSRALWKVFAKGHEKWTYMPEKSHFRANTVQGCHWSLSDHIQTERESFCPHFPQSQVQLLEPKWRGWNSWVLLESSGYRATNKLLTDFRNSWSTSWENNLSNRPRGTRNSLPADKMTTKIKENKLSPSQSQLAFQPKPMHLKLNSE